MSRSTADALIDALCDWGVRVVFGMPGDGINGLMEALRRRRERVRFIQVRHEESAAFMACAYAKWSGRLGVCLATSGPGGIHLLNGLYDAKLDGQPVLAITGLPFHDLIGTHTQQDVELDRLFADVAVYSARVMGPAHLDGVVDLACRSALARRGPAHLSIPVDVQSMPCGRPRSRRNVRGHSSDVRAHGARLPSEPELARAAQLLNAGRRVAILAGRGALGATEELEAVAEWLAAPIAKALLGKAAVPDDSPYTTGPVGLLGSRPSQDALESCDTLLLVGTSFPYMEFYPKPGQARAVQIDLDPTRIGLRYPVEVGLVGDSARTLRGLLPLLEAKLDRSFLERARRGMSAWRAQLAARAAVRSSPMKPQVVAHELGLRLADDAITACDSGTVASWWARHVPARRGQLHSLSGNLASMGCGLPYAIAAQLLYPERQVVAFVGDGGFSMLMAELATCVKYELPIKVIVLKNDALAMIQWEQRVFLGNPDYGCELQPIDFETFARACGAQACTVRDPEYCGEQLAWALRTPGPVLVQAIVDPFEPPLPPRVSAAQAARLARALTRGQPHAARIARVTLGGRVRELI